MRTLPAMPLSSRASRSCAGRDEEVGRAGAYDVQARVGERELDPAAGAEAVGDDPVEPLPGGGGAVVAAGHASAVLAVPRLVGRGGQLGQVALEGAAPLPALRASASRRAR